MNSTLLQMTLIMACGLVWRLLKPGGLTAETAREILTTLVYYLLLPAMIVEVLWTADIGTQSLQYSFLGISSIAFCMFCLWIIGKLCKFRPRQLGTLLLAIFPNVTYLGLPVLEQAYGSWIRPVVIQMDLFAAAPFLFTFGLMVARHYGDAPHTQQKSTFSDLNAPPFWAMALALILNLGGIGQTDWLTGVLQKLSGAVIPLMLLSLGMALNWRSITWGNLPYVLPVILIKMFLMPLVALTLSEYANIGHDHKTVAIMDLAMPSMLLGIVFCDRYRLDSNLYAMTVTITTLASLLTLPFWYGRL